MIEDLGVGSMSIEVFRFRRSTVTHTYLGTIAYTGGVLGDYSTTALVPVVTEMLPGDYMQAQLRTFVAGGGGDGVTLDMHFL